MGQEGERVGMSANDHPQEAEVDIGPWRFPFELTESEQMLVRLHVGDPGAFEPNDGPDPDSSSGWEHHTIRASVLVELCTKPPNGPTHAVRAAGFLVEGTLDLRWREVQRPLRLEGCRLLQQPLLTRAKLKEVAFEQCVLLSGLNAAGVSCDGSLDLSDSSIDGGLDLTGASIGGDLICSGLRLTGPLGNALSAEGIHVNGDVHLDRGFHAGERVAVDQARIDHNLNCGGGRFFCTEGDALTAEGADVKGDVVLGIATDPQGSPLFDAEGAPARFMAEGTVRLDGISIGGRLNCRGGRFSSRHGPALSAERAHVKGDVLLGVRSRALGDLVFDADGAPVRFEAEGTVRLVGATIEGQLICTGGRLSGPRGGALRAGGVKVTGQVRLDVATDLNEVAILARGAPVRFEANGVVAFVGATIGSWLNCRGGSFSNPTSNALAADGIAVKGRVLLDTATDPHKVPVRFEANGTVRLADAAIGSQLVCQGGRFSKPDGDALYAERMQVVGSFQWADLEVDGRVDLRNAAVGVLSDSLGAWPERKAGGLVLDGFRYAALGLADSEDWNFRRRSQWLARQKVYSSDPYRYLASVLRERGDDRTSRKIAMEQFNAQLRRDDGALTLRGKAWRWVLRATIGHGFEPWRALYLALALWALAWWTIESAATAEAVVPTRATAAIQNPEDCRARDYPCLMPALYAADLLLPIVDLGQLDNWRVTGPEVYRFLIPGFTVMGWALTTLVVAGFTSVVRRE
jgi:hypothetical protein